MSIASLPKAEISKTTQVEIRHPLANAERAAVAAALAANGAHFANFAGSQRDAYDALIAQTPVAAHVTFRLQFIDQLLKRQLLMRIGP